MVNVGSGFVMRIKMSNVTETEHYLRPEFTSSMLHRPSSAFTLTVIFLTHIASLFTLILQFEAMFTSILGEFVESCDQ